MPYVQLHPFMFSPAGSTLSTSDIVTKNSLVLATCAITSELWNDFATNASVFEKGQAPDVFPYILVDSRPQSNFGTNDSTKQISAPVETIYTVDHLDTIKADFAKIAKPNNALCGTHFLVVDAQSAQDSKGIIMQSFFELITLDGEL